MSSNRFVEITVQNHMILHGFDENNQEVLEEVVVDKPSKKLVAIERIQSVSEKFILMSYGFGRLIYWEYKEPYDEVRNKLTVDN